MRYDKSARRLMPILVEADRVIRSAGLSCLPLEDVMLELTKACVVCGERFFPLTPNAKGCSRACQDELAKRRRPKAKAVKK